MISCLGHTLRAEQLKLSRTVSQNKMALGGLEPGPPTSADKGAEQAYGVQRRPLT